MTREEILQAISDDKMMPYIQPEQLVGIVDFVIKNYKPSLLDGPEEAPKEIYILQSKSAPNSLGACWHDHAVPSNTCNNIKYIRADLDKQPEEILEEEIERFCEDMWNSLPNFNYSDGKAVITVVEKAARHFAEWQRKQDQGLIELAEDHAMLAGMNKMEQQMMEKGYEAFISADNTIPVLPMKDVSNMGLDYGDNVTVQIRKKQ